MNIIYISVSDLLTSHMVKKKSPYAKSTNMDGDNWGFHTTIKEK